MVRMVCMQTIVTFSRIHRFHISLVRCGVTCDSCLELRSRFLPMICFTTLPISFISLFLSHLCITDSVPLPLTFLWIDHLWLYTGCRICVGGV
uniref:Uncharacterized protein n=1 Tax=Arundo donax TaxID=35708 RepID=A0A0A8Z2V6_ARUDO